MFAACLWALCPLGGAHAQGEYVSGDYSAFGIGPSFSHARYTSARGLSFGIYNRDVDFGLSVIWTESKYYWNRSSGTDFGMRLRGFLKPKGDRPVLFASLDGTAAIDSRNALFSVGPCVYTNAWTGQRSAVQFSFECLLPVTASGSGRERGAILGVGAAYFGPISQNVSIALEAGAGVWTETSEWTKAVGIFFVFKNDRRGSWE